MYVEAVDVCVSALDASFGEIDFSLPAGLREIEAEAFTGGAMTSVFVPDGCESMGDFAFRDCVALRSVCVPEACACMGYTGSSAEASCQTHDKCTFVSLNPDFD